MPSNSSVNFEIAQRMPAKEFSTLLKVSSALASSLDLPVVLQTAIDSAVEVIGLDTGAIYLLEDSSLFLGATTPPLSPELFWLRLKPESVSNHPHLQEALILEAPTFLMDATKEIFTPAEAAVRDARQLVSILYIPLLIKQKAIGAMILGSTHEVWTMNQQELDLSRILANQVSLALANAKLYQDVQRSNADLINSYDATLLGWSLALEMRDQDTHGHTQRVTEMTEELARRMGVPQEQLMQARRGAMLHDIGKIGIPDSILRKAGPLTPEEWVIMRKHPGYAYQFLLQIDYLAEALDIPYCHHEKWDGSGYPRGLKGQEIPLSARIFMVADVFDALTSERSYRKAWSREDALSYVREQTGKHFDPAVVKTFLEEVIGEG
jgi:HD-GYP domain-containing protein (c-di-GMP phosphodiesterase class II)